MSINIKRNQLKRVVIVGGGLGGLRLAEDLSKANLQVVLIDKNNFHQFPPLIYQIASAGIDPSSISFPFRQIFRKRKNFYFRMAEARAVFPDKKILQTSIGKIEYDYLVFAAGTTTNFYGNANIEKWAIPMKTVSSDRWSVHAKGRRDFDRGGQADRERRRAGPASVSQVDAGTDPGARHPLDRGPDRHGRCAGHCSGWKYYLL